MNITKLIEKLPNSVKSDIIDFTTVKLKTGKIAIRILMDRILTEKEKIQLKKSGAIGVECIAYYRYAPEIKKSYFYI